MNLQIIFHPDLDSNDLKKATEEYRGIWKNDGEFIVNTIESISGFKFAENVINAVVADKKSRSRPFTLKYNLPNDEKKATLVHELCHVITYDNRPHPTRKNALEKHKEIDLILYDILVSVFGKELADRNVAKECDLSSPIYKEAWDWALGFSKEERAEKFRSLVTTWKSQVR